MPRVCQLTGKKTVFGNTISHSHIKTKRNWKVNLQKKRFYLEDEKRWVTLRVSANAIKTIGKIGLKAYAKKLGVTIK